MNKDEKRISMSDAIGLIAAADKINQIRKEEEQGFFISEAPWPYCYRDVLIWRFIASAFSVGLVNQLLYHWVGLGSSDILNGFMPVWFNVFWMWIPGLGNARFTLLCAALFLVVGVTDPQTAQNLREAEQATQDIIRSANTHYDN